MKKTVILFVILGIIFLIPKIGFGSDENSSNNSNSDESGEAFGSALAVVLVGTIVIAGASIWGGITTTKNMKKSKADKRKKTIATSIFSEATRGHGTRTNIEILARFYCCSPEDVIDTISELSMTGYIDINKSLINNRAAGESLRILKKRLLEIALKKSGFKKNLEKIVNSFKSKTGLINDLSDLYGFNNLKLADFYRTLFE